MHLFSFLGTINQVEEVVNVLQFEELRALAKELNLKSVGKTVKESSWSNNRPNL